MKYLYNKKSFGRDYNLENSCFGVVRGEKLKINLRYP